MSLDADPRWRMLKQGVACSCGNVHTGLDNLLFHWPDTWPHGAKIEDNAALTADRLDGDFLSADFCVLDGKFYAIRVALDLPLQGSESRLTIVSWSALPKNEFISYFNAANKGQAPGEGRTTGHMLNNVPGYDKTYGMNVMLQAPGRLHRPKMQMLDEAHKLTQDQRQGISLDRTFELYALFGHTMRFGASLN
ncbi:MAG TPA: DUF2199 domain-containing protein [Hyphomonadaceae bacterium]|jgi:hypothetical protein|nr:DUF2199 domain-containing protein [Hyphomonadaceae bacterium]